MFAKLYLEYKNSFEKLKLKKISLFLPKQKHVDYIDNKNIFERWTVKKVQKTSLNLMTINGGNNEP